MEPTGKALFVVMDGLGDRGADTPLSTANSPHLDDLASKSTTGLLHTIGEGLVPGSDTAHLALFGYDPHEYYKGRGAFEALGAGLDLKHGDIAFRTNLCTLDDKGIIIDRRAGRKELGFAELYDALNGMEVEDCRVLVKHTVEHRGAMVLSGPGLSEKIGNTDPHETGKPLMQSAALDAEGGKAARILNEFTKKACAILRAHPANQKRKEAGLPPANGVASRGPGVFAKVKPIAERLHLRAACVAGGALYKGVARYVGMTIEDAAGATGTADTNLKSKAAKALEVKDKYDLVFCHIKATDSFGHDGNFEGKRGMIERVDAEFLPAVVGQFDVIVLTGDHTTACSAKRHTADPVPILVWHRDVRPDGVRKLCESQARAGGLGHIFGREVMRIIQDYLDVSEMFGE
ncbi:MAG: 2,3-bisphosphoglycerate-independent phosphoglycerate mutase [Planctomycetota bacterium]